MVVTELVSGLRGGHTEVGVLHMLGVNTIIIQIPVTPLTERSVLGSLCSRLGFLEGWGKDEASLCPNPLLGPERRKQGIGC